MTAAAAPQRPTVLLEAFSSGPNSRSFRFDGLESVVAAHTLDEVVPALLAVERAVEQDRHAAGFVSYEAAAALNPDLIVGDLPEVPLVWFGIFSERHSCRPNEEEVSSDGCRISALETTIGPTGYASAIAEIRTAIAAGETYQVNFTTRQLFRCSGDPFTLYRRMCRNQQATFSAWIDTGPHRILSASPELFFALDNGILTMKPMKGTAPRAPLAADDLAQRDRLAASPKERAENLMIVDLVRNDLALIAETGSVAVPALFDVETFPTVHQMTSTVTARIKPEAGLLDIFRALFPCGSVTGAPKRRTMEIINHLEEGPRGVYCGAIGYLSPGREALFSVAIRTAVLNMATGIGRIGIGSGITWDSRAGDEFRECLSKSAFITRDSGDFSLIESLRHDRSGYLLLDRHLRRLSASAAYFGFRLDKEELHSSLEQLGQRLCGPHKVRVLLSMDGALTLEAEPLEGEFMTPALHGAGKNNGETVQTIPVIALSQRSMDSSDTFLYHKTTRRELYDRERHRHPDCADVIFVNERGELTEGSYTTIVISLRRELLTPALCCGLLPGVLREELLETGAIREAVLTPDDLRAADTIWLVNSVRGWRECTLVTTI